MKKLLLIVVLTLSLFPLFNLGISAQKNPLPVLPGQCTFWYSTLLVDGYMFTLQYRVCLGLDDVLEVELIDAW
jgi:hypothetical protein